MWSMFFPLGWTRAVLPTAILACLEECPLHGYAIAKTLEEKGLGKLKGGSLYPALSKLEAQGDITHRWEESQSGPVRRQYTVTHQGRARLHKEREQWQVLISTVIGQTNERRD